MNNWVKEEVKEEVKKIHRNNNENTSYQNYCKESSIKRELYIIIGLSQKQQQKSPQTNLTLHLKELE